MGENIQGSEFTAEDFRRFEKNLRAETDLLKAWLKDDKFSSEGGILGMELEAWLVNDRGNPVPRAEEYIETLNHPDAVFELPRYVVEFNAAARPLAGKILSQTELSLTDTWRRAQEVAVGMGMNVMTIGTLPTLKRKMLTLANMTPPDRYKALNQQIFHMREGAPVEIDIKGADHLKFSHDNIVLGSSTAAFQIHLQVGQHEAVRAYNISRIISGPLVALTANSPYLFGNDLHAETRVPLFTQVLSVSPWSDNQRVTFGISYIGELSEIFEANVKRYPVIIPAEFIDPARKMRHVNFHNGTIYRWTRMIVGVNDNQAPTLRLEQRIPPSGPTPADMTANIAFYAGLIYYYLENEPDILEEIPFYDARENFFRATKEGLNAQIVWKREKTSLQKLVLQDLLPKAREGLKLRGLDGEDIDKYLSIVYERVLSRQNGAAWQRGYVDRNGANMNTLSQAYLRNQISGRPVHEWDFTP